MKLTDEQKQKLQTRWNQYIDTRAGSKRNAPAANLIVDSQDEYQAHLDAFLSTFAPQGLVELMQVRQLADIQWRILRTAAMMDSLLSLETDNCSAEIKNTYSQIDRTSVWAFAFRSLDDESRAYRTLDESRSRLSREYQRTYQNYLNMVARRPENNSQKVSIIPETIENTTNHPAESPIDNSTEAN